MFQKLVTAFLAALALMSVATSAHATTIVKIGTLAPGDSPWGKEFKRWANEVSQDTNGEVELDFQWNGQAGDEVLTVQKIRSGQLQCPRPLPELGKARCGPERIARRSR
jgi:TRAP-type C4-dicarboxylate transport system substrate-binding protein